jgi:hypothetical protein
MGEGGSRMTKKEKQKLVDLFERYNLLEEYTAEEIELRDYYGANREGAGALAVFYVGYRLGKENREKHA